MQICLPCHPGPKGRERAVSDDYDRLFARSENERYMHCSEAVQELLPPSEEQLGDSGGVGPGVEATPPDAITGSSAVDDTVQSSTALFHRVPTGLLEEGLDGPRDDIAPDTMLSHSPIALEDWSTPGRIESKRLHGLLRVWFRRNLHQVQE